ncbi:unnamed protein product [Medioppia subpectinata]|uniref:C2H2-type domain-containing protein n=1 Tax=Medioppia subpectinata TaxID=1979941 RepID=A0A7R9PTX7_9ACAR|nr:unnamed protein product [Medioppia subpectinata]CAG2100929.1 unnamed protein product [Medioppia subpectinata]
MLTIIDGEDNQDFWLLCQSLDQLSDETYGSVGHHMKTEFEDQMKSPLNDRQLAQRYETQEVNQSIDDNSDGVNEDMFDNLYESNGLELGSVIKIEPEDNYVEPINIAIEPLLPQSKPSTSQSFQEMVNEDINEESSEDSMEMPSNESMSQFLRQNKTKRTECFDRTVNALICPINECHKSFQKDQYFQQHLQRIHTTKQYICTHEGCGKGLKTAGTLKRHQLIHNNNKSFHCPHNGCQYKAISKRYLKSHLKTHSTVITDRVNRCPVSDCQMAFKSKNELNVHRLTHGSGPAIKCETKGCNDMFYTFSQRLRHRVSVHNRRTYSYRRGKQWFEWKGKTETQEVKQTIDDNNDGVNEDMFDNNSKPVETKLIAGKLQSLALKCGVTDCQMIFASKGDLYQHLDQHMNDLELRPMNTEMETLLNTEGVNKDMSDNSYDSNGLDLRVDIKEELVAYYVEPINTDISTMNVGMQRQVNSISKPSTSQSSQEMVNKDMNGKSSEDSMEMPSKQSMSQLLAQNKTKRKQCFDRTLKAFICPINKCHKSYETDSKFATHLWNIHTTRHHVCTHEGCGQAFKTKYNLRQHLLVYKNNKSLHCPHNGCQYKAISNQCLKIHLKSHSVYKCDVNGCVYQTLHKGIFKKHCARHEVYNVRTIECGIDGCIDMFCNEDQRNRHLWEAHSRRLLYGAEDKYQFRCQRTHCGQVFTTNEMLAQHMNGHNCVEETNEMIGSQSEDKPKNVIQEQPKSVRTTRDNYVCRLLGDKSVTPHFNARLWGLPVISLVSTGEGKFGNKRRRYRYAGSQHLAVGYRVRLGKLPHLMAGPDRCVKRWTFNSFFDKNAV